MLRFKNEDKEIIIRSYSFITLRHILLICNFHPSPFFVVQKQEPILCLPHMQNNWAL